MPLPSLSFSLYLSDAHFSPSVLTSSSSSYAGNKLAEVVQLIREHERHVSGNKDEIELDFETMKPETLLALQKFIKESKRRTMLPGETTASRRAALEEQLRVSVLCCPWWVWGKRFELHRRSAFFFSMGWAECSYFLAAF